MKNKNTKEPSSTNVEEYAKQLGIKVSELETESIKFVPPTAKEIDSDIDKNMDNFTSLLDSLSTTEAKKKALWKQIYQNALIDRRNAYILFGELYNLVAGDANNHSLHGLNLTKYLERMSKANDQLIKLADLVSNEVQEMEDEMFNESNMYDHIKQ